MNKLIFMCGLPASGKSTIANKYREKGCVVLSSDELRKELYNDVSNQDHNSDLFIELYRRARLQLSLGFDVVIDATNVVSKRRRSGLESILNNTKKDKIQLDRNNIHVVAEIIACPYNECIDRNKSRDRKVPNGVIESMYKQWQTPMVQEGFDEVKLTYTSDARFEIEDEMRLLDKIPQFNKNHKLTIGRHCNKVARQLYDNTELYFAGLLHDFGKKFVGSFKDSNNKSCAEMHFYSHESVSSYDSFFYTMKEEVSEGWFDDFLCDEVSKHSKIKTSQLITWHMLPHRLETEKSIEKYRKFFGEEFWNDLMLLHEADKNGRG